MVAYFSVMDKKHYEKTTLDELSEEIVGYLSGMYDKNYVAESEIKEKDREISVEVTVYQRNFLGFFNKKICRVEGKHKYQEWVVDNQVRLVQDYCKLNSETFSSKRITSGRLEEILSEINYSQIISKAEKRLKTTYDPVLKVVR